MSEAPKFLVEFSQMAHAPLEASNERKECNTIADVAEHVVTYLRSVMGRNPGEFIASYHSVDHYTIENITGDLIAHQHILESGESIIYIVRVEIPEGGYRDTHYIRITDIVAYAAASIAAQEQLEEEDQNHYDNYDDNHNDDDDRCDEHDPYEGRCSCGMDGCDGDCGTQGCGRCIDVCRCHCYDDDY